jgi:hypothetical protein
MFKFLKRREHKAQEEKQKKISSITFEINTEGKINILCEWPEFNSKNAELLKDIAQYYSMMLYSINNGLLESDIYKTIKSCDKTNPFNILFYENILIEMQLINRYNQMHQIQNEPLVPPSQVFKEN